MNRRLESQLVDTIEPTHFRGSGVKRCKRINRLSRLAPITGPVRGCKSSANPLINHAQHRVNDRSASPRAYGKFNDESKFKFKPRDNQSNKCDSSLSRYSIERLIRISNDDSNIDRHRIAIFRQERISLWDSNTCVFDGFRLRFHEI